MRSITGRNNGRSLEATAAKLREYLTGWKEYFRLADTLGIFADLDQWIRRRLRLANSSSGNGEQRLTGSCERGVSLLSWLPEPAPISTAGG